MGVLTDFVAADSSEVERVGKSLNPSEDFSGLDAKGMDGIKLGGLYCILTGTTYTIDFVADFMGERSIVYQESEEGPWVHLVPHDLTARVARLSPTDISQVAVRWSKTEEFDPKYFEWPPDAVKQFLVDFAALARQAVSEGKSVLMWVCL